MAVAEIPPPPLVRHDADERVRLGNVGTPRRAPDGTIVAERGAAPVVYARRVERPGGGAWVQYWLWFADNPQDRGIVRSGRHAGDWELAQVRLDARGRVEATTLSQHSGQETCRGAPAAIHVANGSHALYHRAGTRDRQWPDPNDEADGRGASARPAVRAFGAWRDWPGRWGGAHARWWMPAEQSSPPGPRFQPDRWDPAAFERDARRCEADCDRVDACDGGEELLGRGLLTALGAGAVVLFMRRRVRGAGPR